MAFSLDTSGFNVSVPQGSTPLESLKPFSMAGASPLQIKPLAGWSVPSSHPELVAQGIAQGLGAIGQGIQVAYQNKRQDEKDALAAKKEQDRYEAQQRAEAFKEKQWSDRIAGVLPNGGKSFGGGFAPVEESSTLEDGSPQPASEPIDYSGVGPLKDAPISTVSKPLASLSMPSNQAGQFLSATYNPVDADAQKKVLENMSLNTISGNKNMMASTSQGVPVNPISTEPQIQFDPSKAANDAAYSESLQGTQEVSPVAEKATETPKKSPEFRAFPPNPQGYQAAIRESQKSYDGYGEHPKVVADKQLGGWRVDWQHADESKKQRMLTAQQNSVRREQSSFYATPEIKTFTSANGVRQAFPRFIADYEAVKKHPEAAGIHDIGLLDMYARAEAGGRVTEGQANLALQATSLADKAKLLGLRLVGGDHLAPDQRDAMARVMVENHNAGARLANQNIIAARERLMSEGITDEKQLPQPYKLALSREMVVERIKDLKNQALAVKDKSQRDALLKEASEISQKAEGQKGIIVNFDDMLDSRQGYGGGVPTMMIQQGQGTAQ
jgi:hypothetical protein